MMRVLLLLLVVVGATIGPALAVQPDEQLADHALEERARTEAAKEAGEELVHGARRPELRGWHPGVTAEQVAQRCAGGEVQVESDPFCRGAGDAHEVRGDKHATPRNNCLRNDGARARAGATQVSAADAEAGGDRTD